MPAIVTVQNVEKSFGTRRVLGGVSFALDERDRVGVVGLNGAGKSTLLRLVAAGEAASEADLPDAGLITRRRGLRLVYVPQEPALDDTATVMEVLRGALADHAEAIERDRALSAVMGQLGGRALDAAVDEQEALHRKIEALGGWDLDHEIRGVAAALSLAPFDARIGKLSGGERRRVALARALLARPELLLLDEPTNHLDARTVEWLEARLAALPGALVLITHDRYFLDRVATRILELDRGQLHTYEGGYTRFLEKQAERLAVESSREQARASFVRRELDWIRRGPQARTTKQKARIDRFDEAVAAAPTREERRAGPLQLRLPTGGRLGKTILELRAVGKALGGKTLFHDLTLVMKPGDRVGVVGPNGAGKTTLVRSILGQTAPDSGQVIVGQNTRVSYLDQGRADLQGDKTVLEEVAGDGEHVFLDDGPVHVRTFLRMMLFDDGFADTPVGALSGGERNRVQLAKLLRQGGNLLILDEPTNDLDLMTLGVLEEALADFPGCALVVSHDRWFLDRVATSILSFEGDGRVVLYEGNYSDWLARRPVAVVDKVVDKKPPPVERAKVPAARKLSFKEKQELSAIEASIEAAEARVTELEATLADTSIYKDRGAEVPSLLASLEAARVEVERLYARWQELEAIGSA